MVGCGSNGVYGGFTEHPKEINPVCLQNPLLRGFVLSKLVDADTLLGVLGGEMHIHLGDGERVGGKRTGRRKKGDKMGKGRRRGDTQVEKKKKKKKKKEEK